jgi:hypothetical protein
MKDDRHCVSISTGKCFELSAEDVLRYTGVIRSFVVTMSNASGVAEEL